MKERNYCTCFNGPGIEIGMETRAEVLAALKGHKGDSRPDSYGRTYSFKDGEVTHRIGPQPEFILRAPTDEGLVKIAQHVGLPLAG